jgi:hypothetical protein
VDVERRIRVTNVRFQSFSFEVFLVGLHLKISPSSNHIRPTPHNQFL